MVKLNELLVLPGEDPWIKSPSAHVNGKKPKVGESFSLIEKAKVLYNEECELYFKTQARSSTESKMIHTIINSGTLMDRISAITIQVQNSPFHSLNYLKTHLFDRIVKRKDRRSSLIAANTINDLFCNVILPDRKLKYFVDQDFSRGDVTDKTLVQAYFENQVKVLFFEYIQYLEVMLRDPLPYIRLKYLQYAYNLLSLKPEQEKNILALILNKLNDSDKSVPRKVIILLQNLIKNHPAMKITVVNELEMFIYRKTTSSTGGYYAISFMNQLIFTSSKNSVEVSNKVISIYFNIFDIIYGSDRPKSKSKKEQEVAKSISSPKIPAAIMVGIKRVIPYSRVGIDAYISRMSKLFEIANTAEPLIRISALGLIFRMQKLKCTQISDEFYTSLYAALFDQDLARSSNFPEIINLVHHSITVDISGARVVSFIKRALQLCYYLQESLSCALMYMVLEVIRVRPEIKVLIYHPEEQTSDDIQCKKVYNVYEKNPLKANSDKSCLWELCGLLNHFHPTISLYVQALFSKAPEDADFKFHTSDYDPLRNNTLMYFLNKFMNQATSKTKGIDKSNIPMHPEGLKKGNRKDAPLTKKSKVSPAEPGENSEATTVQETVINRNNYKSLDVNALQPVERFIYHFYANTESSIPRERKRKHRKDEGDAEIEDSDDEQEDIKGASDLEAESADSLEGEDIIEGEADSEESHETPADSSEGDEENTSCSEDEDSQSVFGFQSDVSDCEGGLEKADKRTNGTKSEMGVLGERAKKLGYKGKYFSESNQLAEDFASLSDFEELIDR